MLSIQANMSAWNAGRQLKVNSQKNSQNTEKLSSGYKINRAADDAAGLSISEKMRWMIRGLRQGADNTMDGISWVQIGDGAMNEISDMVHRMTELAVKGANGTLQDSERKMIDDEIQHLKKQINKIGGTTTFNEIPIFDNSLVSMDVDIDGAAYDLQIFNSAYDEATGEASFGGLIFGGERITWDMVDRDMVSIDPATGKEIFKEGVYTYTSSSGKSFTFSCEEGASIPDISFRKNISADISGIYIDGEQYLWENWLDEDGEMCTPDNVHSGGWGTDYHGTTFALNIPEGVENYEDLAKAIAEANSGKTRFVWETDYIGNNQELAVDIVKADNIRISNELVNEMKNSPQYLIALKVDEMGISLTDQNGKILANSERTWAELGIGSWESGRDISGTKVYEYYANTKDNPFFSFEFTLSDVTSLDSVIDGLDGVVIQQKNFVTDYTHDVSIDLTKNPEASNILSISSRANTNMINFEREAALGRDFDNQTVSDVAKIGGSVDAGTAKFDVGGVFELKGTLQSAENQFVNSLEKYWDFVEKQKTAYLLAGKTTDVFNPVIDLKDIVGADNVTTSGYFDDIITIDDSTMTKPNHTSGGVGKEGRTYPAAYIDFKDITDLGALAGAGFDSTCKTCNNHYSIVFTYDISGNGNISTTDDGYRYSMERNGNDYSLKIDINSMKNNGVSNGEDLAKALVGITSECFAFHFTQYAAEGSKLYIYDNRESNTGTQNATFYTKPYTPISQDTFRINSRSNQNDYLDLTYTYDFADSEDRVSIEMQSDTDGIYVKLINPDGSIKGYKLENDYDSQIDGAVEEIAGIRQKYNLVTGYMDADGTIVDKETAKRSYAGNALKGMVEATVISFDAQDYTYINVNANEKSNTAVRAKFESNLKEIPGMSDIRIKHSGMSGDCTVISRFSMNTVVMGLYSAGAKTIEQAEKTLNSTKRALEYVSQKRSLYGAYQNRLEHTYNNNLNAMENTTAAESRIRDTDMAVEMVDFSNNNIICQATVSMLSQANQQPNSILQLLQ